MAEIEEDGGIQGYTAEAGLKMKVRARGASRITTQANGLSGTHGLVLSHQLLGEMTVDGLQSVVVAYHDIFAIAISLVAYYAHLAAEGSADGIANIHFYVQSFMHTTPAASEVARYHAARSGHAVAAQVYAIALRQGGGAVGVLIVPTVVEVGRRVAQVLALYGLAEGKGVYALHMSVDGCLTGKQVLC